MESTSPFLTRMFTFPGNRRSMPLEIKTFSPG